MLFDVSCLQLDDNQNQKNQQSQLHFEVVSIESQSDLDRKKANLALMNLKSARMESSQDVTSPQEGEAEESGEMIMSVRKLIHSLSANEYKHMSIRCVTQISYFLLC
jgi:hypothetical protein